MVLPSSLNTNSQHRHTELCTGAWQPATLWLSRGKEAPCSEAMSTFSSSLLILIHGSRTRILLLSLISLWELKFFLKKKVVSILIFIISNR